MTLPSLDDLNQTWQDPNDPDPGPPGSFTSGLAAEQADVAAAQAALDAKNALIAQTETLLSEARRYLEYYTRLLADPLWLDKEGLYGDLDKIPRDRQPLTAEQIQKKLAHWQSRVTELEGRVTARTGRAANLAVTLSEQQSEAANAQNLLDFWSNTRLLMPWMPADLTTLYAETWAAQGGASNPAAADIAMATVTADPRFEAYFPGLKRADGTMRMSVNEYMGVIYSYEDALLEVGVNPQLFMSQFADLVRNEVSVSEFRSRVSAMETRIMAQESELRQIYADYWGLDMTPAALLAGALDPTVGEDIVNRRITIAEIGGEAALQRFVIGRTSAEGLFQAGYNQQSAQTLFRTAGQFLPGLSRASRRQSEGQFDLDSFLASQAYSDPRETQRLGRIQAGEASLFSSERTDVARSQSGAVSGLLPR